MRSGNLESQSRLRGQRGALFSFGWWFEKTERESEAKALVPVQMIALMARMELSRRNGAFGVERVFCRFRLGGTGDI